MTPLQLSEVKSQIRNLRNTATCSGSLNMKFTEREISCAISIPTRLAFWCTRNGWCRNSPMTFSRSQQPLPCPRPFVRCWNTGSHNDNSVSYNTTTKICKPGIQDNSLTSKQQQLRREISPQLFRKTKKYLGAKQVIEMMNLMLPWYAKQDNLSTKSSPWSSYLSTS